MLPQPATARHAGSPSTARRCERGCCAILTYFPLAFVYGLTTWAIWVVLSICSLPDRSFGTIEGFVGVALYILLNWSYTKAVFTDPGSPAETDIHGDDVQSITVKHNGQMRFCNKCNARKPDRAHHCSTCRRCVLKMDHHCPWLATCVGLNNYKFFLLFLIYVTIFAFLCFLVSGTWMYAAMLDDSRFATGSMMPVNYVILSVISGIIGLVLAFFTAFHIYLASQNRTTIESMEKTRYLSPIRSHVNRSIQERRSYDASSHHTLGEQIRDLGNTLTEIHANALPGVFRPEEGEAPRDETSAHASLRNAMVDLEAQRERRQYEDYLDQRDSARLPHAFDLGWRRNLQALFGVSPLLWFLPISTSIGDGWRWEMNEDFRREREKQRRAREWEMQQLENSSASAPPPPPVGRRRTPPGVRDLSDDEDDEEGDSNTSLLSKPAGYDNWNDVPDEMLLAGSKSRRQ